MQNLTTLLLISILSVSLMACQSIKPLPTNHSENYQASLFLDEKFSHYENVSIESEAEIFALSVEMKAMAKKVALERDTRQKATKLLKLFFSPEHINLAYSAGANVIAAEAFRNKAANCLSLTIMAYAIAKEANLNVAFQSVNIPEYWVRNGEVNMLTGHINLSVFTQKSPQKNVFMSRSNIEIDFDPFINKKSFPKSSIKKHTVLAMFYNNKGANAMINGDYIKGYAYLKAALKVDPKFSSAWGNLGILYRFKGYQHSAIKSYRYAIGLNRHNLTAMSNLSLLLFAQGDYQEAKRLDQIIMRNRSLNPYYYSLLAQEQFYQGDYKIAIKHYRKAIKLNANVPEFYFGLAKIYYRLDNLSKAKTYLKKAIKKNRSPQREAQYIAKLDALKQRH
ncbi:tetratricopeptide repeat protein [Colwellia sp. Arc7-635]|uniref:tetratricopeptide repeat protein n=1 Tax=Colwellia sp. Arc7-635 TaxID=2497879 RepID=UPI000F8557BD|nr:tetratricopeptide repeat protein [Colwellia sp. Arc7-635]AZQ84425.1 tetratricopeptide repeat protein [Colwellia sp. Arc7-635]